MISCLVDIWRGSVKATHLFLSDGEIASIEPAVPPALRCVRDLVVAMDEDGRPIGFMGVQDGRLEMLFISNGYRGAGVGGALLRYGITAMGISEVTVNEQNPHARGFYEHFGFCVYKRTEFDEDGRPYPLLYMHLPV